MYMVKIGDAQNRFYKRWVTGKTHAGACAEACEYLKENNPHGYYHVERYNDRKPLPPMNWLQWKALRAIWDRDARFNDTWYMNNFDLFLSDVQTGHDCLMVYWCNMWLGIEKDGYTHS